MPAAPVTERLRVTPFSAARAVVMFGLALVALKLFAAAERVIAWILMAAAIAAIVHPLVERLARRIPRGLAVMGIVITTLGVGAITTYAVIGDVSAELRNLQRVAPERAEELEERGRFSAAARDFDLADRTRSFIDAVPARLRGGTPAEAIRAAATRGLSLLAGTVLTVFFLLHGPKLLAGARNQIHDDARRDLVHDVVVRAYRRASAYARGAIGLAVLAGVVAYVAARMTNLPGPTPLAVWVALWDLVPIIGASLGALPLVALAAVVDPKHGVLLAVVFAVFQVIENLVLQRRIERRSMRLGPFLTVAAGLLGMEVYGLGGALLALLAAALSVAAIEDLAERQSANGSAVSDAG